MLEGKLIAQGSQGLQKDSISNLFSLLTSSQIPSSQKSSSPNLFGNFLDELINKQGAEQQFPQTDNLKAEETSSGNNRLKNDLGSKRSTNNDDFMQAIDNKVDMDRNNSDKIFEEDIRYEEKSASSDRIDKERPEKPKEENKLKEEDSKEDIRSEEDTVGSKETSSDEGDIKNNQEDIKEGTDGSTKEEQKDNTVPGDTIEKDNPLKNSILNKVLPKVTAQQEIPEAAAQGEKKEGTENITEGELKASIATDNPVKTLPQTTSSLKQPVVQAENKQELTAKAIPQEGEVTDQEKSVSVKAESSTVTAQTQGEKQNIESAIKGNELLLKDSQAELKTVPQKGGTTTQTQNTSDTPQNQELIKDSAENTPEQLFSTKEPVQVAAHPVKSSLPASNNETISGTLSEKNKASDVSLDKTLNNDSKQYDNQAGKNESGLFKNEENKQTIQQQQLNQGSKISKEEVLPESGFVPKNDAHPFTTALHTATVEGENKVLLKQTMQGADQAKQLDTSILSKNTTSLSETAKSEMVKSTYKPSEFYSRARITDDKIIEQIVTKAQVSLKGDVKEMKLQLDPPNLGHVKMKVSMDGDNTLTAKVEVETSGVRSAITNNVSQLKESLSEQGIKIDKFEVFIKDNPDTSHGEKGNQGQQDSHRSNVESYAQDSDSVFDDGFFSEERIRTMIQDGRINVLA